MPRAPAKPARRVIRPVRQPYAHAVAAARGLCTPLGMREPRDIDVEAIAQTLGALVMPRPFPRGEGHLLRDRVTGASIIAVRDVFVGMPKWRFVVAHEIGHLLLHPHLDALPRCTGNVDRLPPGARKLEGEASDAGCEIVMPEAWFAPRCCGLELDGLRALASHFGMSLASTALRALQLTDTPSAYVVTKAGMVEWWACSAGWDVYVHRRARVPDTTAAARAASGLDVAGKAVVLAGAAWGDARVDVEVREEVVVAKEDDVVISWLTRVGGEVGVVERGVDEVAARDEVEAG